MPGFLCTSIKEEAEVDFFVFVVVVWVRQDWFLNPLLDGPTSELGQSIEKVLGRKMGDAYPEKP